MSLRLRLVLGLLVAVLIGIVTVDGLTYWLVTGSQVSQVDQELERAHPPIERAASTSGDTATEIRAAAPGFLVELFEPDGTPAVIIPLQRPGTDPVELTATDVPSPADDMTDDEAVFVSVKGPGPSEIRVRVSRQPDERILVIGRSLDSLHETRKRLSVVLLSATAGALVLAGLVGWTLIRLGLRPLVAVERAAGGITDADLERRVPGADAATEVGGLARAINGMLDQLHRSFDERAADMQALQASEARMRRFVADASHELRTPIAATSAYAELFERGARDRPDDLERAMRGIRSETARMSDLVDDLLLLAQLDEGRPLAHEPVDLADIVADAVQAARVLAPDRRVALRVTDAPIVTGDRIRLRQVIDNVIANVRTHTPSGTASEVTVDTVHGVAEIRVVDHGPGMQPADVERAFDRFHRADVSRTRASGGTGLGLAIVESIVTAHGGTIALTSDEGSGTTVVIRIPRRAE
ncbi:MAG: HAMP domain-containing sensor histidine kinase [Ilumatobacteraceae bacterium]